MTPSVDYDVLVHVMVPILAGLLLLTMLWDARAQRARLHKIQMGHLNRSYRLLKAQKKALEIFLNSDAPDRLKSILIIHSDAMSNKSMTYSVARLLTKKDRLSEFTDEDADLKNSIQAFSKENPEMFTHFSIAIIAGTLAAVLRWPDSADLYEEMSTRMALDPHRDIGMAVTASHFAKIDDLPFGIDQNTHVLAV